MNTLTDFTSLSLVEYSSAIIVTNIIVAFALSLMITWVYRITHKGISYSQSFVVSLVMMGVLSAIAMMILGNNLIRALGILGVFTLLRFRTIIKDTRDATYLFFTLAIGMAVGTSNYMIAFIGSVMLSIINFILYKFNFGSVIKEGFLLTIIADKGFNSGKYQDIFDKYFIAYKTLQIKTQADGVKEYYFSIRFKDDIKKDDIISDIQDLNEVSYVDLVTSRDSAEY